MKKEKEEDGCRRGGGGYGMAWQIKEEREEGDKKGKKKGGLDAGKGGGEVTG